MSKEIKMSDILLRAAEVVISRDGDTSSSNGDFACVDIGSIIHLESEISKFFDLDGDYVIRSDLPLIKTRSEKYDRLVEENKRLCGFVKKVAELDIETFHFESQVGDEDYIEYICTDIVDDANELLSELGGE